MLADTWGKWRFEPDASSMPVIASSYSCACWLRAGQRHSDRARDHAVWAIRDARAMSMHAYRNRSQALEAAGLWE